MLIARIVGAEKLENDEIVMVGEMFLLDDQEYVMSGARFQFKHDDPNLADAITHVAEKLQKYAIKANRQRRRSRNKA